MRFSTAAIGILAAGAALVHAPAVRAQTSGSHPTVDGVWNMDTTKFQKRDKELVGLVLHVSHLGDTLLVVTNVQDVGRPPSTMTGRYLRAASLAGGAAPDTVRNVNVESWEGDTLVLRSIMRLPDRTLQVEERWAIDPSGSTLSRTQQVRDGERLSRQTLVFTRRE